MPDFDVTNVVEIRDLEIYLAKFLDPCSDGEIEDLIEELKGRSQFKRAL